MSQTLFWNLLAKKITGEASPEELQDLEKLMKANPDWAYQAEHIQHLWQNNNKENQYESELAFEQHLKKMKESGVEFPQSGIDEADLEGKPFNRKKILVYSFVALAIFIVAGIALLNKGKAVVPVSDKNYSEVSSPLGSKTKLVLPDSTVVWLNAGSKLTYNENFGTSNRSTSLIGEAFFDVKKSSIPFTIHANTIQIKVLGTAFNVKAYPDEKTTETSLIRGRVEITLDKRPGQPPFVLHPNEKLVISNEQDEIKPTIQQKEPMVVWKGLTRTTDSTIIETSWVENKLIFQDESFTEIAHKMERWYGVTIQFKGDEIANERWSGTFTTETIQEALDALQLSAKFHYSIKGNLITITE